MKSFYITTAIDYVDGSPHLGHAYEKVLTDRQRYHGPAARRILADRAARRRTRAAARNNRARLVAAERRENVEERRQHTQPLDLVAEFARMRSAIFSFV